MSNKPTHDVLLAEEWEAGDGEIKNHWTNIGSAWVKESGAISVQFREGLAVSGRVVIMPKKDKSESQ